MIKNELQPPGLNKILISKEITGCGRPMLNKAAGTLYFGFFYLYCIICTAGIIKLGCS